MRDKGRCPDCGCYRKHTAETGTRYCARCGYRFEYLLEVLPEELEDDADEREVLDEPRASG